MASFRSLGSHLINKTQGEATTKASTATANLPNATFHSKFNMVMTNGSAMHDHEIYDFTLADISMPNNSIIVYNGTATITMKQGQVPDVPISIKAMDSDEVSIWIDPTRVNNHFGNTPIFGKITNLIKCTEVIENSRIDGANFSVQINKLGYCILLYR